jgi:hypothetical protein
MTVRPSGNTARTLCSDNFTYLVPAGSGKAPVGVGTVVFFGGADVTVTVTVGVVGFGAVGEGGGAWGFGIGVMLLHAAKSDDRVINEMIDRTIGTRLKIEITDLI